MDLPPELRTMVYRELLVQDTRNPLWPATAYGRKILHPEVMRVSRHVHEEADEVLYGENIFRLKLGCSTRSFPPEGDPAPKYIAFRGAGRNLEVYKPSVTPRRVSTRPPLLKVVVTEDSLERYLLLHGHLLCRIRTLHVRIGPWAWNGKVDRDVRSSVWHLASMLTTPPLLEDGTTRRKSSLKRVVVEDNNKPCGRPVLESRRVSADDEQYILSPLSILPAHVTIMHTSPAIAHRLSLEQQIRPAESWFAQTARYIDAQRRYHTRASIADSVIAQIADAHYTDRKRSAASPSDEQLEVRRMDPSKQICADRLKLMADWEERKDDLARELEVVTRKHTQLFREWRTAYPGAEGL